MSGTHLLTDLTLGLGTVVHDYLNGSRSETGR
jgi:acetoacetate decarboxylase